ncbi:helix-turn-helix domain-containing protein [Paraflavitalea pollutisoli]|uniref:helix-turn-helix domain-containing protein n=1 Tax=Paraflavitalea pollutisoli TaxID=3034143 RepID=UPI0023EB2F09|nr:helix-turn-helix domain-containing protein [Paraflavitalea sp. H1-2-19X]
MTDAMFILPGFFKVLFLMAGLQGIILTVVLWRQRTNQVKNHLLAWLVLMFSAAVLFFIATYEKSLYFHPAYPGVAAGWILGTAGANFLLMYVRASFGLEPRPRLYWLYWIPTLFFTILAIMHIALPRTDGEYVSELGRLGLIYIVVITCVCYYKFRTYSKWGSSGVYSAKTIQYLRWVLLFFATYSVMQIISFVLWPLVPFEVSLYLSVIVKLLTTVGIYAIAYLNVQHAQQVAPVTLTVPAEQVEKYRFSSLDESKALAVREQLLALVSTEKVYLQRDFKIKDLADRLNIPVHTLSQVLNERLGVGFSDFVNKLRVEEAVRLLAAGDDSKIESLALDTGFNNKVSFNKAFKKFTGVTPSQYKNKLLGLPVDVDARLN